MLDLLRRAVKSWVAKVLLGLLVLSFAVWGIGDVASGFSTTVATVGDRQVEAEVYGRALRREQQRYGLDATQIRSTGLDRFVLAQLVREAAFADAADRLSLSAPDTAVAAQVRADPAFQVGGAFDPAQYQAAVRRNFPSVAAFEETVRDRLIANQLGLAAQLGAAAPAATVDAIVNFREERRAFDAVIAPAEIDEDAPLTDAALQAHLDANADAFQTPETRAARWLTIDPVALAGPIDEDALREAYAAARQVYVAPEAREARQLVFASADEAAAARARLDAGEATFETLAAERGLSPQDTALGAVTRDDLPDARGEALFGAPDAGVTLGPVDGPTGPTLLRLDSIAPEIVTPFEDVRADLEALLAAERGRPAADRLAEEVEDLRAAGATLGEVADELDLPLTVAPALTAQGPLHEPRLAAAARAEAFAAEPGEERDLLRTAEGGYLVVEVDSVTPPGAPALNAVREAVAADLRRTQAMAAARERAEAIAQAVRDGASLADAAGDLEIQPVGPLRRGDPDPRLGPGARETLFAPDARVGAVAFGETRDGAAVLTLREVLSVSSQEPRQEAAQALSQSMAQDYLEYLGRALQDGGGVSVNQQAVEAVLAQIGT